jgi:methionine synthase II (cobalamin-independent)
MATNYHAEHVGSLLRPAWLLEARAARQRGEIGEPALRELEDRAALEGLALQRAAGLEVFTDGEVRRATWMAGLLESTGGVVPVETPDVPWYFAGNPMPPEETEFDLVAASEKVTKKAANTVAEAEFLSRHAPGIFKITMMSASMGGILWRPGISDAAYPTPSSLVRDLAALQAAEMESLIGAGVRWLQLDSLSYNQVFDDRFRAGMSGAGMTAQKVLDAAVSVDADLVKAAKRADPGVTVGMHICRGNNRSGWMAEGSYEPVAERLFGEVGVDRFLLEYDTGRAGGFEPLRFIRPGTTVVLGLVSSKYPQLETQDYLLRRIEEASTFVPIEDLALSPQCGFASTARGNQLTVDDQRRKLELVVTTAHKVWG